MQRQAAMKLKEAIEAIEASGSPPPKREAILAAASRVFLDRGYGAARMDTIARAAPQNQNVGA